ncbi:MAG: ribonuclease Z [Desulfobacterales bacterium]|nr:ribonuclease Z [Desulfobacterales bacterium]
MRPSFHPRLINGPFDDPGLFIPFAFENRAILFDLGEIHALSARDVLKVTHVFVSHTHMDHFAGFDRLLRLFLGREKILHLYGPDGFLKNVQGKLNGYSWNLVERFTNQFIIRASEIHPDEILTLEFPCRKRFQPAGEPARRPFDGVPRLEPSFSVSAVILEHDAPCLGFSFRERFHVNVIKEALASLHLPPGPWLNRLKSALYEEMDPATEFTAPAGKERNAGEKRFTLGELAERITRITPGQKITYIADAAPTRSNMDKITALAMGSDHLFIESAFLEKDREIAMDKRHLTAWRAGAIAGRARVKRFSIFHFSPRYTGEEALLWREARTAYKLTLAIQPSIDP